MSIVVFFTLNDHLNSVSSICAHGKSCVARKPEVPQNFLMVKTFKKCNPPDFKFYLCKVGNKTFSHMVQCYFLSVFTALNGTKKQRKFNITPYGENFY